MLLGHLVAPILYASVFESVCLHKAIVPFVCACVWCFEHSNITLKWLNTALCVCVCVRRVFSHYLSELKSIERRGRALLLFTDTRKRKVPNNIEWIPLSSQVLAISSTFECLPFSDTCTEEKKKRRRRRRREIYDKRISSTFLCGPPREDGGPSLRPLFV